MELFVENSKPAVRMARGWSRLTPETLATESFSTDYVHLDRVIKKWTLYRAVDDGATALGVPRIVKDLLLQLLKYTKEADFAPGRAPLVWPSNAELSDRLGIQPRQIINRVNTAISMGLLLRAEGNAPRRNGARNRETGEIVWARGLDLRPLVLRFPDFVKALADQKLETKLRKELLRQLAIAWRRCTQLVDQLMTQEPESPLITDVAAMAISVRGARDNKHRPTLEQMIIETLAFGKKLEAACWNFSKNTSAQSDDRAANTASNGANNYTRITNTNQFIKLSKDNTCIDRLPNHSSADLFEASSRSLDTVPNGFEDEADRLTLTPDMVVEASPALDALLDPRVKANWKSIYLACMDLRRDLGISRDAFAEVLTIMGPVKTMLAIAIAGGRRDEIDNPGGWLRALCDRDIEGKLYLTKSIYGLLQRYGKHKTRSAMNLQLGAAAKAKSDASPPAPLDPRIATETSILPAHGFSTAINPAIIELLATVPDSAERDTLRRLFEYAPALRIIEDGDTLTLQHVPAVMRAELIAHHDALLTKIVSATGFKAYAIWTDKDEDGWIIAPSLTTNGVLKSDLLIELAKSVRPGQLIAWAPDIELVIDEATLTICVPNSRSATALQTHFWPALRIAIRQIDCSKIQFKNSERDSER